MSNQNPEKAKRDAEKGEVTANPQPTPADKPPIPQPATDGFPTGGEDLTSRVPGEFEDVTRKKDS